MRLFELLCMISEGLEAHSRVVFSLGSTTATYMIGIVIMVIECLVLAAKKKPAFGLRFVPIFGEYYYYHSLLPEKRLMSGFCIGLKYIYMLASAIVLNMSTHILDSNGNAVPSDERDFVFLTAASFTIGLCMASFVLRTLLDMDLAKRFKYRSGLGFIWAFLPIVRAICCLVRSVPIVVVRSKTAKQVNVDNTPKA